MSDDKKWEILKEDVQAAVNEGFERTLKDYGNVGDRERYNAYRYVLDLMNKLEGEVQE